MDPGKFHLYYILLGCEIEREVIITLRCPGNAIARHRIAQFSKSIAFLWQVLWQGWSSAESAFDFALRPTSRLPAPFAGLRQRILALATTRTMGCSISHLTFVSEPASSNCGCVERQRQKWPMLCPQRFPRGRRFGIPPAVQDLGEAPRRVP